MRNPQSMLTVLKLLFTQILVLCCYSATYMTFAFVYVKNPSYLSVKRRVERFQPLAYVLVHRTFADAELLCCAPYRSSVFYYVLAQHCCTFFHYSFHKKPSNRLTDLYAEDLLSIHSVYYDLLRLLYNLTDRLLKSTKIILIFLLIYYN